MGQCQTKTTDIINHAVQIVEDKKRKSDANTTSLTINSTTMNSPVGVLPNQNQEPKPAENLIEMHAKLNTEHFHMNAVSEWNNDNASCDTSTSTPSINESCSESVLSDFTSIAQKISQEKKQQKLLDKQAYKEDKKFYNHLFTNFQEMQQHINDEDSVSSSNCSMNLKDNSTWFIDFNNLNNDNAVLPDDEASSLGESIHSMPSLKDDKDPLDDELNYKVLRRRRISALNNDTPAAVDTPITNVISNSTFSINTPSEKDSAPLQKPLHHFVDNNDMRFDIYEMDDGLHPLDSDSDNDDFAIDTVPCSIQISIH